MSGVLRQDPGTVGLVSGVGMHMTKHVFGVYRAEPGPVAPPDGSPHRLKDQNLLHCSIVEY